MLSKKQIEAVEETWDMKLENTDNRGDEFKKPNYYLFEREGELDWPPLFPGDSPRKSSECIEICFLENRNSLQVDINNMNLAEEITKLANILEGE